MGEARRVALLGATGSIGTQTLDVLRREPESLQLVAVAGGSRLDDLIATANEFDVEIVVVADSADVAYVHERLEGRARVVAGDEGIEEVCGSVDVVVNAIVGFAGVPATLATLRAGARLALANKESLIAAAPLVQKVRGGADDIVPIDSEHCAIHQCLAGSSRTLGHPDVRRLLITASGGPFRGWTGEQLSRVSVADALAHPTWVMGPKITVDSSTLMNKGLEVLEAAALFSIDVDRIDVVVHPQSIVHSMVEYVDGSVIAQLSNPDMRLPIAYALGRPVRFDHAWGALNFSQPLSLSFEPPDRAVFRCLDLAYEAARLGGAAPAWLSAANEVAVDAFLHERLAWNEIAGVVATVLDEYSDDALDSVEALYDNDARARALAQQRIDNL